MTHNKKELDLRRIELTLRPIGLTKLWKLLLCLIHYRKMCLRKYDLKRWLLVGMADYKTWFGLALSASSLITNKSTLTTIFSTTDR